MANSLTEDFVPDKDHSVAALIERLTIALATLRPFTVGDRVVSYA